MKPIGAELRKIAGAFKDAQRDMQSGKIEAMPERINCEVCQDLGMVRYSVPVSHPDFGRMFPCPECERGQALVQRAYENTLRSSGLAEKYRDMTFDTFFALPDPVRAGKTMAYMLVMQMAINPGQPVALAQVYAMANKKMDVPNKARHSVVVTGDFGTGKTGLGAALMNDLALSGRAVPLYMRVDDMLDEIKAGFDDRNEGAEVPGKVRDMVKRSEVLILDEFTIRRPSDFDIQTMEKIIRYRHGHNLPTLITTNADQRGLEKAWGRRTVDVLLEMAHFVTMGGVKLRDTEQPKVEVW